VFFKSQQRLKEAERLYRYALGIFEKALGPKHPKYTACLKNYSKLKKATCAVRSET